jgi:hypothetical protein
VARKISFGQAKAHPNSYYYRHLPPGEEKRTGPWTADEKRLFLARMQEMRAGSDTFGHDWGIFSLSIPGRVGYQCSNFYRSLLSTGELRDARYAPGDDGRLHHTSRVRNGKVSTYRKGKNRVLPPPEVAVRPIRLTDVISVKLTRGLPVQQRDDVEDEKKVSRYESWAMQNPIPGAVDLLTGEAMRVPAMAPDGYVLDYKTWVESLSKDPVSPFTRVHVNKRQLVILTTDNYHEYAHKIVNLKD